ncbi:acetylornithine aminotransferase, partial [Ascosphaera atra]
MQEMFPTAIEDVRGLGLMLGVQLTDKYKGKVGDIVTEARNNGVLVLSAGNGVIRLLPVLNVGYVKSMTGLKALESAIAKVVKETEGLDPVHVEQHGSLKEPSVAELQASANPEVPEDAEQAQEGEPLEAAQETQQESEPAEATQEAQQEGEPAEATQEAQQE